MIGHCDARLEMAELDFGDSELFEQLDGDEGPKPVHIRFDESESSELEIGGIQEQLARCETIAQLRAENQELKKKLSVVSQPSGLFVEDKFDGPLLQILFMNHVISKQFHQEIEDFVSDLFQKYEEQKRANPEKTTFNIKPQPSSFFLEENEGSNVDAIKKINEAFSVVGSALYFTNFCLDKLGQPLLNENPQLTDGWEVPKYQQVFTQIMSLDGQEVQIKAKRPKPCCFNCGSEEHQLKDCPKPRNNAHIGMKRKEFMDSCGEAGNPVYQQRYHAEEVDERFARCKPGVISSELHEALGTTDQHLPPFIYRMRQLGYPPGWLKDAELENSGLALYDGRDASDGEIEDLAAQNKSVSYDVSKLVSFPGFNTPPPSGVADDWRSFGSIPMQQTHQKEIFARYLSYNFPKPNEDVGQKRSLSDSGSERKRQKTSGNTEVSPMDMDFASDSDLPTSFTFQPPLPPYMSPPPMPCGTPPSTPRNFIPPPPPTPTPPPLPKGTPPPTPNRESPLLHSKSKAQAVDGMDEDTLTLEELEEQQRLIWAALEKAESTNGESDVNTPLNGNSVTSSPSRTEIESVTGGKVGVLKIIEKPTPPDAFLKETGHEPDDNPTLIPKGNDPLNERDGDISVTAAKPNGTDVKLKETEVEDGDAAEEAACAPSPLKPSIPDRDKFAEEITPFEFDNMSEATGTYLQLRNVLKNSPRNQQRSKK